MNQYDDGSTSIRCNCPIRELRQRGYVWDTVYGDKKWNKVNVLNAMVTCQKDNICLPMEIEFWNIPIQYQYNIAYDKDCIIARLKYWHIHGRITFTSTTTKHDYDSLDCCMINDDDEYDDYPMNSDMDTSNITSSPKKRRRKIVFDCNNINDIPSSLVSVCIFHIPLHFINDVDVMIHVIQQQPWILFHKQQLQLQQHLQQVKTHDDDISLLPSYWNDLISFTNPIWDSCEFFMAFIHSIRRFDHIDIYGTIVSHFTKSIRNQSHLMIELILTIPNIHISSIVSKELLSSSSFAIQLAEEILKQRTQQSIVNNYNHKSKCNNPHNFINVSRIFKYLHESIRDNENVIKEYIQLDGECWSHTSIRIRSYRPSSSPPNVNHNNTIIIEIAILACLQNPKVLLNLIPTKIQSHLLSNIDFVEKLLHVITAQQIQYYVENYSQYDQSIDGIGTDDDNNGMMTSVTTTSLNATTTIAGPGCSGCSSSSSSYHRRIWQLIETYMNPTIPLHIQILGVASTCLSIVPMKTNTNNYIRFWKRILSKNPTLWYRLPKRLLIWKKQNSSSGNNHHHCKDLLLHTIKSFENSLLSLTQNKNNQIKDIQMYQNCFYQQIVRIFHSAPLLQHDKGVWKLLARLAHPEIEMKTTTMSSCIENDEVVMNGSNNNIIEPTTEEELVSVQRRRRQTIVLNEELASPLLYWLSRAPVEIINDKDLMILMCQCDVNVYTLLESSLLLSDSDIIHTIFCHHKYKHIHELMKVLDMFQPTILLNHVEILIQCMNNIPYEGMTKNLDDSSYLLSRSFNITLQTLLDNINFRMAWCRIGKNFPNEYLLKYKTDHKMFLLIAERDIDGIWFRWCCRKTLRSDRSYMKQVVKKNANLLRFATSDIRYNDYEILLYATITNNNTADIYLSGLDPDNVKHVESMNQSMQYIQNEINTYQTFMSVFQHALLVTTTNDDINVTNHQNDDRLVPSQPLISSSSSHENLVEMLCIGTDGYDLIKTIADYVGVNLSKAYNMSLHKSMQKVKSWGWEINCINK